MVKIEKISNGDELIISTIISLLEEHFNENYKTHGGSKLPVLAFYSMYKILIKELGRYQGCKLLPLGSHTASDRTSKSAGDIEVAKGKNIFESVEVKLDKAIDITMTRIAYEKIARFNPIRYYILSYIGISENDKKEIQDLIEEIEQKHGCQLIVNGLLHTLRYYLRLISDSKEFFNNYIELVKEDTELKPIHKIKLKENSIDTVIATELFEHIPNIGEVLAEIYRILKPSGLLYLTVPFIWPLHEVPYDEFRYTPYSLERFIAQAKFKNILIHPIGCIHSSLAQILCIWISTTRKTFSSKTKKIIFSFIEKVFFYPLIKLLLKYDKKIRHTSFSNNGMFTGFSVNATK